MSIATFFVLTRVALRTARATRRDALCACGLTAGATDRRRVQNEAIASPASQNRFEPAAQAQSCALPTWWFWRGGRTRSHSEHGRETPQRRWYFVLRRGRVGRCQVCKTQDKQTEHLLSQAGPADTDRPPNKRPFDRQTEPKHTRFALQNSDEILARKTQTRFCFAKLG
jgi:hypothetical protein